jgi:hypothetical protein
MARNQRVLELQNQVRRAFDNDRNTFFNTFITFFETMVISP